MSDHYEFDKNRRPDRTYVSAQFVDGEKRPMRIASAVLMPDEDHHYIREKGTLIVRVTRGEREYIKATFYEDTRNIQTLTFHRYTSASGVPHKTSFSFGPSEIERIIEFLLSVKRLHLPKSGSLIISNEQLRDSLLSSEQIVGFLREQPQLAAQIMREQVTTEDVVAIGYRRAQLREFGSLMALENVDEGRWQRFFEVNQWIFGYGLQYIFSTGFDGSKLERWIVGHNIATSGKRADAVMKTRGIISSLCLVEIKKHNTSLLCETPYRKGCWAPSEEVAGGVIQLQTSVRMALQALSDKITIKNELGEPSGEVVYNHQPKSFLVVGSLDQFVTKTGVNEDKLRSFELFRANMAQPQIITFDELYERAKFIVNTEASPCTPSF